YTGSLGLISGAKVELNILIRTASFRRAGAGRWMVGVRAGAGIVMDSDPRRETRETALKARALLEALSGQLSGQLPGHLAGQPGRVSRPAQPPSPGIPWRPPAPRRGLPSLRVLLLDNEDSFTQNLAHDLAAHGAEVVLRPNSTPLPELLALRSSPGGSTPSIDAVLVGPGPGTPQSCGVTLALTRACLALGWPVLGVCLGHQALGETLGAGWSGPGRPCTAGRRRYSTAAGDCFRACRREPCSPATIR
ncbi:MAG: glutamine amidotransferase-related protein, partial [Deinococcus sp.]